MRSEFIGTTQDALGWTFFSGRSDDPEKCPKARMMADAQSSCSDGAFIAMQINCPTTHFRRFTYAPSWPIALERLESVDSHERHAYEMVRYGRQCKPYLDFDMKNPTDMWTEASVISTFEPLIIQIFREDYGVTITSDALKWSSGSRPGKLSLHCVVSTHSPQYVFATNRAGEHGSAYSLAFRLRQHLANVAPALMDGVDKGVYSRDREMRLIGSTKCESRDYPLKALDSAPFADHCITWLDNQNLETLYVPTSMIGSVAAYNIVDADEVGETFSSASLPLSKNGFVSYKRPYSEEWVDAILRLVAPRFWQEYTSWLRICMAMKSLGMPFDTFDALSRAYGGSAYGNTREQWRSVRSRKENTPSLGTLCHFAKESDPIEYARLAAMPENDPRAEMLRDEIQRGTNEQARWSTRSLKRTRADGQTLVFVGAGEDARVCGSNKNERYEGCAPYALVYTSTGDVCVCCKRCKRTGKRAFVGRIAPEKRKKLSSLLQELE